MFRMIKKHIDEKYPPRPDSQCHRYNFNDGSDIQDRMGNHIKRMYKYNLSSYAVVQFFQAIKSGALQVLESEFSVLTEGQKRRIARLFY